MTRVNPVKAVLYFLFAPSRFVRLSTDHAIAFAFKNNPHLAKQYPNRDLPGDKREEFHQNVHKATKVIQHSYFTSLWTTAVAIISGFFCGRGSRIFFGEPSSSALSALQIAGAGLVLVATLAQVGWAIRSWGGETLPEKVERWIFRGLYWFGTFLFVVSLGWSG